MTIYACVKDGIIATQLIVEDSPDGVGPPPPSTVDDDYDQVAVIPELIRRTAILSPTTLLFWNDGEPAFRETAALVDVIAAAVLQVDVIADHARAAVVGDPVRVKEYERAQQQAEQYRDAGFAGTVPAGVACWAVAKEWTPQRAAEDILAASARWLGALDGIRALRLQAKEDIRRATTNAQVDSILATFTATLAAAMQGVQ